MRVDGRWSEVDPTSNYTIAVPSFISEGKSKQWRFFVDFFPTYIEKGEKTDYDALKQFIEKNSPITQEVEGRFRVVYPELKPSTSTDPSSTISQRCP